MKTSDEILIEGKRFVSAKKASSLTGYTHDYIGQISRAGKIQGKLIGRTRFVDIEALYEFKNLSYGSDSRYINSNSLQQEETLPPLQKKSALAEEKILRAWGEVEYETTEDNTEDNKENDIADIYENTKDNKELNTGLSDKISLKIPRKSNYLNLSTTLLKKTGVSLLGVTMILFGGSVFYGDVSSKISDVFLNTSFLSSSISYSQTPDFVKETFNDKKDDHSKSDDDKKSLINKQIAAVSRSNSYINNAAAWTYEIINKFFSKTRDLAIEGITRPIVIKKDDTETLSLSEDKDNEENSLTAEQAFLIRQELKEIKEKGLVVEKPQIITKTITKTPIINIYGVDEQTLEDKLNELNNKLLSLINNVSARSSTQADNVFKAVSISQKIDKLTNTTATNLTVSGVTGLTDSDIPNTITASNYLPLSGGNITGTLGIGTSSPSAELGINGLLYVGGAGTSTIENNLLVSGAIEVGGTCINCGGSGGFSGTSLTATDITSTGTTTLGNATSSDITYFNSRIASSLIPTVDNVLDIGESDTPLRWRSGYFGTQIGIGGTATTSGSSFLSSIAYLIDSGGTLSINTTNNQDIITGTGNFGIGTTTPYAKLSVVGQTVASYFTATTTISSTFPYASTTAITSETASTTDLIVSNDSIIHGNATTTNTQEVGALRINGQHITDFEGTGLSVSGTSLTADLGTSITLTSEVDGVLPVANGGTGWGELEANTLLLGNGTNKVSTTTAGTNGQILALLSGVPEWTSTTTFSGGLTYSSGNVVSDLGTSITLTSEVDGILPVANGGTNASTLGADMLLSFNGTSIVSSSTPTASHYFATSTIASTFPYASTTAITAETASTTNLFISSIIKGSVLFSGTDGELIQDNASLFFDDANNRLGIGTTTPWGQLSINPDGLGAGVPSFVIGSSTATYFLIDNGGKVGIGTTSPWGQLSVEMDTNTPALVVSNNGSSSPAFYIGGVNQDGVIGVGTTGGTGRRLDVFDAANPQLRLSQTASIYTDFQVAASTGDLTVSLNPNTSADDIFFTQPDGTTGVDLWVCQGSACPSITINNGGNVVAENAFYFGNGFRIDQVVGTTTEIAIYGVTATTTPIVIFDEQ